MLSVSEYKLMQSWNVKYSDGIIKLDFKNIHSSWFVFIKEIIENTDINKIEKGLMQTLRLNKKIFPYPDLVFAPFIYTNFDDINVVIIGQDPYFKSESGIPQAMGLSFSVADGLNIPSSLDNIYKNMQKFGHIHYKPTTGNLQFLAYQGVLLLNTSLTVPENEKNAHEDLWAAMTDLIIVKLSSIKNNLIFVLWGNSASKKHLLIDKTKHKIIISSHPSGLSCNTMLKTYPAFNDCDHFGQINNYLREKNKRELIYGL